MVHGWLGGESEANIKVIRQTHPQIFILSEYLCSSFTIMSSATWFFISTDRFKCFCNSDCIERGEDSVCVLCNRRIAACFLFETRNLLLDLHYIILNLNSFSVLNGLNLTTSSSPLATFSLIGPSRSQSHYLELNLTASYSTLLSPSPFMSSTSQPRSIVLNPSNLLPSRPPRPRFKPHNLFIKPHILLNPSCPQPHNLVLNPIKFQPSPQPSIISPSFRLHRNSSAWKRSSFWEGLKRFVWA